MTERSFYLNGIDAAEAPPEIVSLARDFGGVARRCSNSLKGTCEVGAASSEKLEQQGSVNSV